MRRSIQAAFGVATLLAALLVGASPASAKVSGSCFGYTGTFRDSSRSPYQVDWNGDDIAANCSPSPSKPAPALEPGQPASPRTVSFFSLLSLT
jgi:hypothetical protein